MNHVGAAKPDGVMPWHAYPAEPPMNGQLSPYPQTSSTPATWTSGTSEAGSHDEMNWGEFPSSIRSLSYSGESTENHAQTPFMSMTSAQPYERRQSTLSDVYPPPFGMANVNTPTQGMPGTSYMPPDVVPWQQQQQQIFAAQGQANNTWSYGASEGGGQVLLTEEQRGTPRVSQGPSGVYYST